MTTETHGEPTDEALLSATARGDLQAFHLFYQRYAGRVFAYARKISRDSALAEDIAQEVFTTVWTRASTFRPDRGGAPSWLYTLTRNKLIDHWRRTGCPIEVEATDNILSQPSKGSGEMELSVRQALSRVAPEQRAAIEMAYYGGFTYEETAGELALPVGTLKSRIRAGLRAMRELLSEEPPEWPVRTALL
jgi:RNA polymerase sigma-70 factor (ECF subfamily)